MKKLILLSFTLLLFSCSKSIYYEYSNNGKYATLEIKNKILAIYRSNSGNFIYTESALFQRPTDTTSEISFSLPFWMYYIDEDQEKFNICSFKRKSAEDDFKVITYAEINKDSIVSVSKSDRKYFIDNGTCFKEKNINWFPPYFTKVKKIDYKKFNLPQIENKYLKDPIKAPMVYDK
ncbi:hypothetical protein SAMN04488096_10723 [Mesonia phycicola]|uniref:Lipoprotein n=1 Tax=Mesonia phycicola TaxID=579105 RepID=A0A1M6FYQ7_9FLAO|nr:hypothetical protein [Mesonia phycicola]SHJ02739.1 hypothetical protein SAMN04488096_10723 [Mesonia phycicola]